MPADGVVEKVATGLNDALLLEITFTAEVIEWRGPAPFYFAAIPAPYIGEVRWAAREASYGWGVVPVTARIGASAFTTSLFPRSEGYLLPLKLAIRKQVGIATGDIVEITMAINRTG